jgi:hypothetical protein
MIRRTCHATSAISRTSPVTRMVMATPVVITGGEAWWTLAFEATGGADLARSELEATAAFVFVQALPGKVGLGMKDSWSYAQWLWRRSS